MERIYCVFVNPQTGLYAASTAPQDDVAARDCTRAEALRLCETLNAGLTGWQRELAVATQQARAA